jgi:negative regulator of flagellin synthesis FlgM
MSSISGVGGNSPIQRIAAPAAAPSAAPASSTATTRSADKLELSGASHLLHSLKTNNIRADKVASIKAQIENGTYEDDHKLDAATNGLLDDLLK